MQKAQRPKQCSCFTQECVSGQGQMHPCCIAGSTLVEPTTARSKPGSDSHRLCERVPNSAAVRPPAVAAAATAAAAGAAIAAHPSVSRHCQQRPAPFLWVDGLCCCCCCCWCVRGGNRQLAREGPRCATTVTVDHNSTGSVTTEQPQLNAVLKTSASAAGAVALGERL